MAGTLRITRQQLAKFLGTDHDAIRQFETLFSTVAESDSTAVVAEPEIVVETAAHEALARIERLERAFQMLELIGLGALVECKGDLQAAVLCFQFSHRGR